MVTACIQHVASVFNIRHSTFGIWHSALSAFAYLEDEVISQNLRIETWACKVVHKPLCIIERHHTEDGMNNGQNIVRTHHVSGYPFNRVRSSNGREPYLEHPAGIAFTGMDTRRYHDALARTKRFRIACKRCDREKITVVPR